VQSISSWAPSCIGPYAQAVSAGALVHFAGQIGLDPPVMSLVLGGPRAQAVQCLRSCHAVSVAAKADLQHAMLGCTIYAASARPVTPSQSDLAASSPSVAQTFGHAQQMLTAFQQGGLPRSEPPHNRSDALGPDEQSRQAHGHAGCYANGKSQGSEDQAAAVERSDDREEDLHDEEPENEFVDEYLRPPRAALTVQRPLLTYVEAEALPKGAVVELQPLALHCSWPPDACHSKPFIPPLHEPAIYCSALAWETACVLSRRQGEG
jgi:enamine deaminase RidA (YjgF/YER057c/UK114 family)